MDSVFLSLLGMSFTASIVIVAVLVIRLLLKKAPKVFSYAIWAVVLFRLLSPFSFESAIGLLPSSEPIPQKIVYEAQPEINTGFQIIDNSVNEILPPITNQATSVNPIQIWIFIGRIIWSVGIFVLILYSAIQYALLKHRLIGAKPLRDNIYLADGINSPFVMGLFKPKIYLPSALPSIEYDFIISHEKCHIKRLDHITRALSFLALALHWFNPLVWVAYIVSGKDMEMSCDEAVMKNMDRDIRAEYSTSLLRLTTGKKLIFATPLAFGEGDTKSRVKNVMKYKKPVFWVSAVCLVVVLTVAIGFMTNQKSEPSTDSPLTKIYAEIYANDTLERPIQTFANMQIGNEWYIGVLAGDDIVLSTASNIDGDWKYQGNIIYQSAHDGNSVVFSGKENPNGRYDIFLSTNPNLASITRTFEDGEVVTVYVDHEANAYIEGDAKENFSPTMTIMEISNDSNHLELLYKDANGVVLEGISTQNSTSENEPLLWDLIPMVMIDDKQYLDTGKLADSTLFGDAERSDFDGFITSTVNGNERPYQNNQSNFGDGFGYRIVDEESIAVYINEEWYSFKLNEQAFTGDGVSISTEFIFLADKLPNPDNLKIIDEINTRETFAVTANLPESWEFRSTADGVENIPAGDFYQTMYIYSQDEFLGYIGFNIFTPPKEEISAIEYYKSVYINLRMSRFFTWDPYTVVKSDEKGESGIVQIHYEIPNSSTGESFEAQGVLVYDKELAVYVGLAFIPDKVTATQIEDIAKSIEITLQSN